MSHPGPLLPSVFMPASLPFRFAAPEIPLILVPAHLNGRGPHHLLIDTGKGEAEPILFRPLASALGLTTGGESEQPGVAGPVQVARTRLDHLDVGGIRRTGVEALVMSAARCQQVRRG